MDDTLPAVVETPVEAGEVGAVCGLEGCGNLLPAPAIDEHGRRKGGRPSRYCSKAHTDAASRARRLRDTAAVSDPLSEVRSIGAALLPGVRELVSSLATLEQRFAEAEQQAWAQVAHAEAETGQAREEAADAVTRADHAEQARREALAQARDHQLERDQAVKEADRIRQDAEKIRSQAWETVATHERARGQAEAAHAAAAAERDRFATELRAAHTQLEHDRAEHTRLTNALTAAQADLADDRRELDQLRQDSAQARAQLGTLKDQLRTEQEQRHRSQAQVRELETELRGARDRLTEANARLDTLIAASIASSPEPPQPTTSLTASGPSSWYPIWLGQPSSRPACGPARSPGSS
ncbi:MAG: hypothetical protein ACRDTF_12530 [Pseudonocardiaceae bacterium]